MAKDRIERDELANKSIETAGSAEDPLRAMAELLTDFVMEADVTAKVGAEVHERSVERHDASQRTPRAALGHAAGNAANDYFPATGTRRRNSSKELNKKVSSACPSPRPATSCALSNRHLLIWDIDLAPDGKRVAVITPIDTLKGKSSDTLGKSILM